jgi:hypothetical protein
MIYGLWYHVCVDLSTFLIGSAWEIYIATQMIIAGSTVWGAGHMVPSDKPESIDFDLLFHPR